MPVVIERGSPPHRALQLIGWVALAGVFFYVVNAGENFLAIRWAQGVTLAIAILGLNIVTGNVARNGQPWSR